MRLQTLLVLALLLCPGWARDAEAQPTTVVVSILPQRFLVERLGGPHVAIEVLVGPGQNPATYEVTPAQMRRLSSARAWFLIGVPFEAAWRERVSANAPAMHVVDTTAGIARRTAGGAESSGQAAFADVHVWTSPRLLQRMAATMRDALTALDPTHAGDYQSKHARLAAELSDLDQHLRTVLAPAAGLAFLVFHPSWGYLADEYGLVQLPVERSGKEPGPRSLSRVVTEARRRGITAVFVQKQFSQAVAEQVAREIGGVVVEVDPLAPDVPANLMAVAQAIATHAR